MSGKLIGQVYERQLGHAEQAVLLAMADHADDFGNNCFPSVPYVAWKTGYHERQIQRLIVRLRDLGALVFVRGATRYRPTEYRIDVDALPAKEPFRGDISASPGVTFPRARGDISAPGVTFEAARGDIAMSPEPSYGTEEEDICEAATAAVAAPSPMQTTQSAHAVDVSSLGVGLPPKARRPRTPAKPADPRLAEMVNALADWQGYPVASWPQEMTGAKRLIALGHDLAVVEKVWRLLKEDPFWQDKHLSLQSVAGQIGAKLTKVQRGPLRVRTDVR